MKKGREAFIGIDTAKVRNAVTVAEGGREGELRYLGEFDAAPDAVAKLVRKLADRYETLHFCYEAGPTGYGLYRQIVSMGHECTVVAPSMIPRKPGDRVKTNRRDSRALARLHRAGELTAVWVPDETHETVRKVGVPFAAGYNLPYQENGRERVQWRVIVELSSAVAAKQVHEVHVGGNAMPGYSATTLGLSLAEAKSVRWTARSSPRLLAVAEALASR
jgi:hypothetical protein